MMHRAIAAGLVILVLPAALDAAGSLGKYYAQPTVEDRHGAIAPWWAGQNGPLDERVRIAADIYKRYPWVGKDRAVLAAPHIVYNTHWKIADDGTITVPPTDEWMCGDLGQRAISIVQGLAAHHRYSGDPLAFLYIPLTVDTILDHNLTPPDHPWPRFPIATPTRGKGYAAADPRAPNQLDLCAMVGTEVLRAYRLTGYPRYLEAAARWGETLAAKRRAEPGTPPWGRYMNVDDLPWSDELTGSTLLIIDFLDDLLRLGIRGPKGSIEEARDAGRAFIRDSILPRWWENDAWGRHYWDWENPVMCGCVPWCCENILAHPDAFPDWKIDVRNILSLIFNRNCVDPGSRGDAYSGAWAFPETSSCCGTSLSYNQYTYAPVFLEYGLLAGDPWAKEIGRRMILMATYDSRENGVVLDGLEGKVVAAGEWLNLAHPWPLCQALKALEWSPELAPARENHILASSSVVTSVVYGKGRIEYRAFDGGPPAVDVLRLAFDPRSVTAEGKPLARRNDLEAPGFTALPFGDGDSIVRIRRDGALVVVIEGDDPQEEADDGAFALEGAWAAEPSEGIIGGSVRTSSTAGARASFSFTGNQVRIIGKVGPEGGRADVSLDGARQLAGIDFYSPAPRRRQVVWSRSGLAQGRHEVSVAVRGEGNPISKGAAVWLDGVGWSAAEGKYDFGESGGPTGPQRMVFGATWRKDHVDSRGNTWRPATEWVVRSGYGKDSVTSAWWNRRRSITVLGTPDPEIYRYGAHAKELWANLTVGPGRYAVRLLFADTGTKAKFSVEVNGKEVLKDFSPAEAAGGTFRAVDRTFGGIEPSHGMIEVRLRGSGDSEAAIQALELVPEQDF
jgi:hypothetical protein